MQFLRWRDQVSDVGASSFKVPVTTFTIVPWQQANGLCSMYRAMSSRVEVVHSMQCWMSGKEDSKVLGLALDYDIFLLGRALAAGCCIPFWWIRNSTWAVNDPVQWFKSQMGSSKFRSLQLSSIWMRLAALLSTKESFGSIRFCWAMLESCGRYVRTSRARFSYDWCCGLLSALLLNHGGTFYQASQLPGCGRRGPNWSCHHLRRRETFYFCCGAIVLLFLCQDWWWLLLSEECSFLMCADSAYFTAENKICALSLRVMLPGTWHETGILHFHHSSAHCILAKQPRFERTKDKSIMSNMMDLDARCEASRPDFSPHLRHPLPLRILLLCEQLWRQL